MTTGAVIARDARPPVVLVRLMNPMLRRLLPTPLGRLVKPFALLEFNGRRSGRRMRVPVGWHSIDTGHVVFTPAPWRDNFAGGIPVIAHHRGHSQTLVGTLDDDPDAVAAAMNALIDRRGSLRSIGVDLPPNQRATPADVRAVSRALITFSAGEPPDRRSDQRS